jgi:ribosomal protein L24
MVGKDKGKTGEVLRVIRDERFPRVFVSGLNMVRLLLSMSQCHMNCSRERITQQL